MNDMDPFNKWRKESKAKKRKSLYNILKRNGLLDRCRFPNEGTVIVDNKYTYYCQKKTAIVKGFDKKYQMRGVQHFIDVFLK